MPVVSAIIPFHRVQPHLAAAVGSVLAQTLRDLEVVAVDNGTGLGRAALGPAGADPRVTLVTAPSNLGISGGRNLGIAAAKGRYIALLDYDDLAWPERFDRQVAALEGDRRLALIGSHADTINVDGRRIGWQFTLTAAAGQQVFTRYSMPATTSTYTGRRELFARLPFRSELDLAEDYDFLTRAAELGPSRALAEPLGSYRWYGGQSSQSDLGRHALQVALVRLAAARRRAGRPEDLAGLRAHFAARLAVPPPPAGVFAAVAEFALRDGSPDLVSYHARRLLGLSRHPLALARALHLHFRALVAQPRAALMLNRLFFTGPLRTHGLRPVPVPAA